MTRVLIPQMLGKDWKWNPGSAVGENQSSLDL